MSTESFQTPEGLFSHLDPNFLPLIGKVTVLSALLEAKVWMIVSSIDNKAQSAYAGENVSENLKLGKERLKLYNKDDLERRFALSAEVLFDDISKALATRNELVHRVWSISAGGVTWGWKPLRNKREEPVEWSDWRSFPHTELDDFIAFMGQLISRARQTNADAGSVPRRAD